MTTDTNQAESSGVKYSAFFIYFGFSHLVKGDDLPEKIDAFDLKAYMLFKKYYVFSRIMRSGLRFG